MNIKERIKQLSIAQKNELVNTFKKNDKSALSTVNTQRLVAYIVVQDPDTTPAVSDLKNHLGSLMPQYMVPQSFVFLDKIPLSPNGKVNVNLLPDDTKVLRENSDFVAAEDDVEKLLVSIWESLLGQKGIGIHDNFFEIGGDSILSIQIVARAKKENIHITPKQLFLNPTISELSKVATVNSAVTCEQQLIIGNSLITPIQQWLFDRNLNNINYWNQGTLFKVPKNLDVVLFAKAIDKIIIHHDALRSSFNLVGNKWQQTVLADIKTTQIAEYDLSDISNENPTDIIENLSNQLHASLDISIAKNCAAALFHLSESQDQLYIAIHHLVVDVVSWSIIVEDIETAYKQLQQQEKIKLPLKTTSFRAWAQQLEAYAKSSEMEKEQDYWLSLPSKDIFDIPIDHKNGNNLESSQKKLTVSLSLEETHYLLKDSSSVYNTKIDDILLTALAKVITDWTGKSALALELEGHGREYINDNVDLSRTVGWFTSSYPVFINYNNQSYADEIKSVKEQLRKTPNKGIGYGILRYMLNEDALSIKLASKLQSNILYNNLGQLTPKDNDDGLLTMYDADNSHHHDLNDQRSHQLEIDSMVVDDQFKFEWFYSDNIHSESTIELLANSFITELLALIEHCKSPDSGGVTASDFPDAELDQDDLEDLLDLIDD